MINRQRRSRVSEYTDRFGGKAPPEVIPDRAHGRPNREFKELRETCTLSCGNAVEIIVPRRTKFDALICTAIQSRKDLHPFVELLGERCQVLGVVKFGIR